jgi:hypothetical protein
MRRTNRSLESFKIFPYLAWALVMAFAVLVYYISVELRAVAQDLSTQSEFIETQVKINPMNIKDFNPPTKNTDS